LALSLIFTFNSLPTIPAIPEDQPEPPSPEEIYLLEELAEWVLGRPITEEFRVITEMDVADAVRSRRRSFELFRGFGAERQRKELVSQVPFGELIWRNARRYGVDGLLIASIMEAESGFDPRAVSPQGALGLMQVMPLTAEHYSAEEPLDPAVNIDVGARYFASLLRQFDGDVTLALAGYNAGPSRVTRYGAVPPFRETQSYVGRVLSRYVGYHQTLWERSGTPEWVF
jgi:soluble lytic murein transglycosylase-like protein